jgi:lipid-A-disaccharide synthase
MRGNLTAQIKLFLKSISLRLALLGGNLIMDKKVVTELIQEDCNLTLISKELNDIIAGDLREEMLNNYEFLAQIMGKPGASEKTAKLICQYLQI